MSMRKSEMFWWGVIAAVFASSAYGYNYHDKLTRGYCASEGRFLGEQELIDTVVDRILRTRQEKILLSPVGTRGWVQYDDLKDFYGKNVSCCNVALATSQNINASPLMIRYNSRAFKSKYFVVEIITSHTSREFQPLQLVDACGKPYPKTKIENRLPSYKKFHEITDKQN